MYAAHTLISNNVNIALQDVLGRTALMFARHEHIARMLIDSKANVNLSAKNGYTALLFATEKVHAKSVVTLLRCG